MERKGFTLVEIMAVLVVLCLIMLVGAPSISKTIKKQEEKSVIQYNNSLCIGAKNYARHNSGLYKAIYEDKGSGSVCSRNLYDSGYISTTLKHPTTNKKEEGIFITMNYNNGDISCTINVDKLDGC